MCGILEKTNRDSNVGYYSLFLTLNMLHQGLLFYVIIGSRVFEWFETSTLMTFLFAGSHSQPQVLPAALEIEALGDLSTRVSVQS